jgi:hypothetical protein
MKNASIDVIGLAETNLKWNSNCSNVVRSIFQKQYKIAQVSVASNDETCMTCYQPGGALTAITSKYSGRITGKINDDKNLGRWSGFTLSTNFTSEIHIVTVYQSVVSDGLHSAYKQQQHRLQQLGKKNPDPRKTLLEDLQQLVEGWNKKGDQTIILIDANDK